LVIVITLGAVGAAPGGNPTGQPTRPLTEAESVRLALVRPAVQALAEGRIAQARSEVTAEGQWPNPEFEYAREQVNRQPTDTTEEFYWLSQRFEISGQRGLRKEAAEHRVRAATLVTEGDRVAIEADVRARFYQVLHQQEQLGALEDWTRRLSTIEAVIRKREAAGDVSGYDALRLSREQSSAHATLRKEQAHYKRLWAELASVLGGAGAVTDYDGVTGRLLPEFPPPLSSILEVVARRPDIARLAEDAQAHDLERRAGERGWVPELTLGVGLKTVDDDLGSDSGPMIAAGITIPLFDRGQAERQRASANAVIARSQYRLTLAAAEGELRGLWIEVTELTSAAREQHRVAREDAARLIEIAEVAYRGGELGVLELLDAYRGANEVELQALEMAASARQARVELNRMTGE
jgi:cobalt-zinc-cadmium efflux system outer membrane protein